MRALRPLFESMSDLSRVASRAGVAARANSSGQSRRRRTHRAQRPFQRTHLSLSALPRLRDSAVRPACNTVGSPKRRASSSARRARPSPGGIELCFHPACCPIRGGCACVFGLLRFYQRSGLQRIARTLLPAKVARNGSDVAGHPVKIFSAPKRISCPPSARAALKLPCSMAASCRCCSATSMKPPCACCGATAAMSYFPKNQICCGALNIHNGESVAAKQMARRNIDAFLDADGRRDYRQRRRLRRGDEGIWLSVARRSRLSRQGRAFQRTGQRRRRISRRISALIERASSRRSDRDLPGPLPSGARPAHSQPTAKVIASDPRPEARRDGRRGSLLRQRRHLQLDPRRHVATSAQGKNAVGGGDESGGRRRAQSRLHAAASLRRPALRTRP